MLRPYIYGKLTEAQLEQMQLPSGGGADYPYKDIGIATRMDTGAEDQQLKSIFGTLVWADVKLNSGKRKIADLPELSLDVVLVEISQTKNIVMTAIQGRNGTVKEYINDGDFNITIRGGLFGGDAHAYPIGEVRALDTLMKAPMSLPVISEFLRIHDIYDIVVTDYRYPQQEGFQNVQLFEINCVSDAPINLIEGA